jgi:hypothetical protein
MSEKWRRIREGLLENQTAASPCPEAGAPTQLARALSAQWADMTAAGRASLPEEQELAQRIADAHFRCLC